jgi:CheY-like chemotaxis protein
MQQKSISILLAEDDDDDCILFQEALSEIPLKTSLTVLRDGEILMNELSNKTALPDVLFLDLNMPRKNGCECLIEIKQNERIKDLPVIILSTSFDEAVIRQVYDDGACYYLRKPGEFSDLKMILHKSLQLLFNLAETKQSRGDQDFVLSAKL